jgi:8-oxo-dGTP diphosphatase
MTRILAAGGLLWRDDSRLELLCIHRNRYDDWCLPKGKLRGGETFEAAALREVEEETGWRPRVADLAGELLYDVGGREKSVLFWNMVPDGEAPSGVADASEVDAAEWFTVTEALSRLSYADERALVRENAAGTDR